MTHLSVDRYVLNCHASCRKAILLNLVEHNNHANAESKFHQVIRHYQCQLIFSLVYYRPMKHNPHSHHNQHYCQSHHHPSVDSDIALLG